jgi:hypothetical protein
MKENTMDEQDFISREKLQEKWLSRRNLIRGAAGTAAGAGLLLGSGLRLSARVDDEDDEGRETCGLPLPLPHTTAGPFGPIHFYFPGPIDGSAAATDATGTHAEGRDPSTITNFEGFVGQVDLTFSGTGMDTKTGATAAYKFHTDTRFMKGVFIASDERRHHGAFAFI